MRSGEVTNKQYDYLVEVNRVKNRNQFYMQVCDTHHKFVMGKERAQEWGNIIIN